MNFDIITIFPKMFNSYFNEGMIKRASDKKIVDIKIYDLRDWTSDAHKTVDDSPFGGGAGMVMKIEPLYRALKSLNFEKKGDSKKSKSKIILLSAKGKRWTQQFAQEYSQLDNITMICGRYEGVDERILNFIDEEISIGDFVLTGGEIGAMTIVDSVTRLLPDVLGNEASAIDESHSAPGVLEYPQYTRPEIFTVDGQDYPVPPILLSGDHKKIKEWREKNKKNIA